jgi:hypothetical protein
LIAGKRIARRLRWPLILDYRDPWSAYDWPQWHRGWLAQWLGARIEARLVRASAARVLNTPNMRDWFEESFPGAEPARNFVVPNGFDAAPGTNSPPSTGPIEIMHAGEIYGSRSLLSLLRAVDRLNTRHPARPIQVINYGALPPRNGNAFARRASSSSSMSGRAFRSPRCSPFCSARTSCSPWSAIT